MSPKLVAFFGLSVAAFAQGPMILPAPYPYPPPPDKTEKPRPLDDITSRQYQREVRPLRRAVDRWLQRLELQEIGVAVRLVKASELEKDTCGQSIRSAHGFMEIDVLRSDEYAKLPDCLPRGAKIRQDQLNTALHEVLHMVISADVDEETKVTAIAELIQPTLKHK